jgi:hypothetical protein
MAKKPSDEFSEEEAQRRFEEAVKGGLKTPPIAKDKEKRGPKPAPEEKR